MMQNPRAGDAATQAATMASGIMDNPPVAPPCEHPAAGSISLPGLLASFLKIGALGFGGGMAVIALMERELIRKRRLLPADQFLSGVGLGQILGSFAANASFFVGYRLYGLAGAVLSVMAFLLPSLALVIALSDLYFHYHRIPALQGAVAGLGPVVIALILNAAWSLGRQAVRTAPAAAIAAAALAAGILRVNTVWILLCAAAAGFLLPGFLPSRRRPSALPGGTFRWPSCPWQGCRPCWARSRSRSSRSDWCSSAVDSCSFRRSTSAW